MRYVLVVWSCLAFCFANARSASAYTVNETDAGHPIRWAGKEIVTLADPAFRTMLADGEAFAGLAIAFEAWHGFERVPEVHARAGQPGGPGYRSGQQTNGIYYVADWPYEAEKLAVTVVTYELRTGRMLDADILVNGRAPFRLLDEGGPPVGDAYDLAAVLAHEAGHVLGLGESDADPEATMWPYAHPGDMHQRSLSDDDETAVLAAYSGSMLDGSVAGCGGASVAGSLERNRAGILGILAPILAVMLWSRYGFRFGGKPAS